MSELYYYEPSSKHGEAVAYIRGGHPGFALHQGKRVEVWEPAHFDVGGFDESSGKRTSTGVLTDFLHNTPDWLIVNGKVRALLEEAFLDASTVQWLGLYLHQGEHELLDEYFIANILDVRSAVDVERSRYVGPNRVLTKLVLSAQAVEGADLFRLRERQTHVYFSHRLKGILERAGVSGVRWVKTQVCS